MGTLTPEYRWLLPSALTVEPDETRVRRSTRDWVIDALGFVIGLGFALFATIDSLEPVPHAFTGFAGSPDWVVLADGVIGIGVAISLWWRRRYPVALALASGVAGAVSLSCAVSGVILLFTVAVHRRFGVTAAIGGVSLASSAVFYVVRPERNTSFIESMITGLVFTVIAILWGMVVRARRQLVVSLRDRAERAEAEQQLRVAQARVLERNRIAREMHDVLAHRISLLSLHAGALEIRPDAAPAEVAGAAGVIRASAHQALQDLREVIGVLREEPAGDGDPERPQPTLLEVPALVEESRAAGGKVRLDVSVDPGAVPELTGRTAYRIVQEGLTNARKHAPGAAVAVAIGGAAGDGLTVEIRNPWPPPGAGVAIPGAGTGLIGLAERAALAGGRLAHGRNDREFTLTAWLPWPVAGGGVA